MTDGGVDRSVECTGSVNAMISAFELQAWLLWKEDKALELMDSCLEDSYVQFQVLRCIQVGLLCVQKLPEDRPAMPAVVFMLGNEGVTLPQPKQPGFFVERSSADLDTSTEGTYYTQNNITCNNTARSQIEDTSPSRS